MSITERTLVYKKIVNIYGFLPAHISIEGLLIHYNVCKIVANRIYYRYTSITCTGHVRFQSIVYIINEINHIFSTQCAAVSDNSRNRPVISTTRSNVEWRTYAAELTYII